MGVALYEKYPVGTIFKDNGPWDCSLWEVILYEELPHGLFSPSPGDIVWAKLVEDNCPDTNAPQFDGFNDKQILEIVSSYHRCAECEGECSLDDYLCQGCRKELVHG